MNNYLIPANAKKGQLIFNLFRWEDLLILLGGAIITLILAFAIKSEGILIMALKLTPLGVAVLLVMPVAYYHNVLVCLKGLFAFLINQKVFKWRGWCVTSGDGE